MTDLVQERPLPRPPARPTRLVYFGTPAMAVPPLVALHDAGFDIAMVVTGEDKRRRRRSEPEPTPVKAAALERSIPVTHDLDDVPGIGADLGVVVAFGKILRRPLLEQLPMVNLHFSLLPRWRGAAPVERALLAGDGRTGVCVMAVEEGLDTGAVYATAEIPIEDTDTAYVLGRTLTQVGSQLLVDALRSGLGEPVPQSGEITYAAKLGSDDRHLQWTLPAVELDRVVRVGGAWTTFRGGRLKVHEAIPVSTPTDPDADLSMASPGHLLGDLVSCGEGWLQLVTVQPENKGRVSFADWANGARPEPDEPLGGDR